MENNFDIKNLTSFKIGGKIKTVYFPENISEFEQILNGHKNIKVFGNLSNILISSDGFSGEIILTTKMTSISIEGIRVIADAGVKGPKLSQMVCEAGLSGLEFMIGFPGSVGGEVYMNASANGQAISDKLVSATCYNPETGIIKLSNNGKAIPKEKQKEIFKQGYTTKQNGCGLGLAICKNFLESQNAKLTLTKSTKEKTTFEIRIPISA